MQILRVDQDFMFEFQGTMYFFKATNLIGVDKLGAEVSYAMALARRMPE